MRRIGIAGAVAVVVSLGVAGGAGAAPLTSFDSSSAAVATDGARYATWPTTDGATNVWDTRSDDKFVVQPPDGCNRQPLLGGGHLAWVCPKSSMTREVWAFSLAARTYSHVPGVENIQPDLGGPDPVWFSRVGRRWLEGHLPRLKGYATVYVRLSDGKYVRKEITRSDQTVDLDHTANPLRRLCRRIRRLPNPDYESTFDDPSFLFAPMQYERPFAATQAGHWPGRLVLRSCLGTRPKLLARQMPIDRVQLGAGFVTWSGVPQAGRNSVANAYVPRSGRRFRWTVFAPVAYVEARHTANRIFVSESTRGDRNPTWLLKSAPFNPR
jgi:hypothetical protein